MTTTLWLTVIIITVPFTVAVPDPRIGHRPGGAYLSCRSIPVNISHSVHSGEGLYPATLSWEQGGLEMRHIKGGEHRREDRRWRNSTEQWWTMSKAQWMMKAYSLGHIWESYFNRYLKHMLKIKAKSNKWECLENNCSHNYEPLSNRMCPKRVKWSEWKSLPNLLQICCN